MSDDDQADLELSASLELREDGAVLRVEGEIDLFTAPRFEAFLTAALRDHPHLVVDLRAVGFMDSTGLRALLHARRAIADAGGGICLLVTRDGAVARLLELAGVAGLFGHDEDAA
jgi:anti-sigma B factor antagonist